MLAIFVSHTENFILFWRFYTPTSFISSLSCCWIVIAYWKIEMFFTSGAICLISIPFNMWIVVCHYNSLSEIKQKLCLLNYLQIAINLFHSVHN